MGERDLAPRANPRDGGSTSGSDRLRQAVQRVLDEGPKSAPGEAFGRSDPLWSAFEELKTAISLLAPVSRRATLKVGWGAGLGRRARVGWLALLDHRETTTMKKGLYCVFLFRQDMS